MSSPTTKRAKLIARSIRGSEKWGKAQKIWNGIATREEKYKLLRLYCHASKAQAERAVDLPWEQLSLWVKKHLKTYFRKEGRKQPPQLYPEAAKGKKI